MHYLPCPIQILKYSATLNSDIFYEFWEWKKKQIIDDNMKFFEKIEIWLY